MAANSALADAIRIHTRRLLDEFAKRANGTILDHEVEKWVRSKSGDFVRRKSSSVFVERLLYFTDLHDEILQWPEYKSGCELLGADPRLSHIDVSDDAGIFSPTPSGVLNGIGIEMLKRRRSFEY